MLKLTLLNIQLELKYHIIQFDQVSLPNQKVMMMMKTHNII